MRTETFHTPGRVRLEVRVPSGDVTIEAVPAEETRVELEALRAGDEAAVADAVVEARESSGGTDVVVAIEEPRLGFLGRIADIRIGRASEIRVRISCPEGAELDANVVSADLRAIGALARAEIKSVSADLDLDRLDGNAALKTVSGDVRVGAVAGRATFQTVSGDVGAARVGGPVEVRTVSGDVRIDEAGSGVTGQTVSGDVRLGSVGEGSVVLKSVSGDLEIGIRQGSRLWVDAKSISGETTSELALGEAPGNGDGPLVELRASAMSGDIRVSRA